jgi:hypothetical protein
VFSAVVWCERIKKFQNKGYFQLQTELEFLREYKYSYCTHFNTVTTVVIMNVLEDDVNKVWKFHSEQTKLVKSSLEGHLLLLQLNSLHLLFRV